MCIPKPKPKHLIPALPAIIAIALLTPCKTIANAAVFAGYGHDIKLLESEDVQMLGEDITITPERGPNRFDGSVSGMNRVRYICIFTLKNLRANPVTIQVGFPLESDLMRGLSQHPEPLARAMEFYSFKAHDGGNPYNVRYEKEDQSKNLRQIFLWDMTFKPSETKTLHITYSMPMSMGLATTNKNHEYNHEKTARKWLPCLEAGMAEFLGYVTKTGASWAGGTIGKAKFTLKLGAFEHYLQNRPFLDDLANREEIHDTFPAWEPARFRTLTPVDGWNRSDKGDLTRTLKNYSPAEDITVFYYSTIFPRTAEDTKRLVEQIRKWAKEDGASFASTPQTVQSDFDALRDIFREFNGTRTQNASIQEFIKQQKWHGLKPMQPIPEIVFQTLEQLRNQATRQ